MPHAACSHPIGDNRSRHPQTRSADSTHLTSFTSLTILICGCSMPFARCGRHIDMRTMAAARQLYVRTLRLLPQSVLNTRQRGELVGYPPSTGWCRATGQCQASCNCLMILYSSTGPERESDVISDSLTLACCRTRAAAFVCQDIPAPR